MVTEAGGRQRPHLPRSAYRHRPDEHSGKLGDDDEDDALSSIGKTSRESSLTRPASPRHGHDRDHHRRRHHSTTHHSGSTTARSGAGSSSSQKRSHHRPRDGPDKSSREDRSTSSRRSREHAPLHARSSRRSSHANHLSNGDDEGNTTTEVKPWFKKKTLWTGVATMATVLALVPASVSAKGSREAAAASMAAARASKKSATASTRSANAVEKSANAAVGSSMAQGHIDERGHYTGSRDHFGKGKVTPLVGSLN